MIDIAVCVPLPAAQMARLRAAAEGCSVREFAPDAPCECAVVFGNPEPAVVAGNTALRWLQLESVGFGEYVGLDLRRRTGDIQVTNLTGMFSGAVAETALAGILALYRGVDRLLRLQDRGIWEGDGIRPTLRCLSGARVVLFGSGAINRRLVELMAPFGCLVTVISRGWTDASLAANLSAADVVVAAVPHTPQTEGVFSAARLAQISRGAVFCNVGRGSLVDEHALDAALRAGRLAGAVIDVTREEPLPAGHPFWTCPNLILTQHSGGGTADEIDRKLDVFLANLALFRAGLPLQGRIDFARGY